MRPLSAFLALLLLVGCEQKQDPATRYDAKALLKQKCSQCHNLDMPPQTSPDEKAPPMMAVTFHVRDFMKVANPAEKRRKFIDFVTDYALNPSAKKSYCDKKSLESYGVMPSQKGNITPEELQAVAGYMYDHYDPEKFMKIMTERARLAAMPAYKRVLEQKNCLGCHGLKKDKVAPAFAKIAKRYRDNPDAMAQSIRRGSRGKWAGFKLAMPPFKDLTPADAKAVSEWILKEAR